MEEKNNLKKLAGENTEHEQPQRTWKDFFKLGEVGNYFFRGKDPSRPSNINLKMMHGINKISILIFLVGVLYLVYKLVLKPML